LARGVAQLRLSSGILLTVDAPTRFDLIDAGTVRLHAGRLHAVVPTADGGFSVRTPRATIIDRGTAFGVSVDESLETLVQVYEGRVEAKFDVSGSEDQPGDSRRVWPQTALRIVPAPGVKPEVVAFEPRRFIREVPQVSVIPSRVTEAYRISLNEKPTADEVIEFVRQSPAIKRPWGEIFADIAQVANTTQPELDALVPKLIKLLDDNRSLPLPPGQDDDGQPLRVCDRADLVLQFIAGIRPEGRDRQEAWADWWAAAKGKSRPTWLANRRYQFDRLLRQWRYGASYEQCEHARNAVEIAVRSGDRTVLPFLMDLLRQELPTADTSEVPLDAIVKGVAELGGADVIPPLVYLAEELNRDQLAAEIELTSFCEPHARRSTILAAFATALSSLAQAELPHDGLRPLGPARCGVFAIEEHAFDVWRPREAAAP
jgi:hypothetical protein